MTNRYIVVALVAVAASFVGGCNRHAIESAPIGFLSQPGLMKKSSDGSWQYTARNIDWSKYNSAYVAPVSVAPGAMKDGVVGDQADLPGLAAQFQSDLQGALASKYPSANAATAGTLVVRAQIVKAEPNAGALNLAPQTQIGGAGYGYGEIAVEVIDGGSGKVLVEFADVQSTKRFSTEKFGTWDSLKKSFEDWSARIAKECGCS